VRGAAAGGGPNVTESAVPRTYALLADGSTVEVRHARPADRDAVRQMHADLSPANAYFRFFHVSPRAPEREAERVCRPEDNDHVALLALLAGQLVGVATYEATGKPGRAEIAFAVSDEMHGRGVATLLLEYLVSLARQRKLTAFEAETLPDNYAMQRVFADAGLPVQRHFGDGVVELTFPLPAAEGERLEDYLDAVAARASQAGVASLRHLFEPASVAVVGAGRQRGSVGREILRNIVVGGFPGQVYAVNPSGGSMEGIDSLASALDLPEGVDLAVIAVPPGEVAAAAASCGRRGVRTLIVITAGIGAAGAELLAICRRYGMRLVGPNCFGLAVPSSRLNATFASRPPRPGGAGLVMQSGGIGIALLEHFGRLGIGVSSFASVGDKYDVSSNDLLTWWEQDGQTRLAVLYVESFGNPRAFARTARRVGRRIPVLTIIGGRSAAGQRAAASHTAAAATPLLTQEALFGQAGIIATRSLGELIDAAALLSCQPLPVGRRVAIISNAGGTGVLAADACADVGLTVAALTEATAARLAAMLPPGSAVSGPVDTTAGVSAETFRACVELVAADESVDALVTIGVPTAVADLSAAIAAAQVRKPMAVVLLDQADSVRMLAAGGPPDSEQIPVGVPAYAYPESAVRALGHAADYRAWRDSQRGAIPELTGLDPAGARSVVTGFLAGHPDGGWLPEADAARLLACYRIPVAGPRPAAEPQVPGEGVATVIGEPQAPGEGVATVIGVVQEPVFGPLVVFGVGTVATEVLGDRLARLSPLTDVDAQELIGGVRAAPLLTGHHGGPAVDTAGLAEVLLRVSRLADDLPEVAELDLNPVVARPREVQVLAARARLAPAAARDPFLRRLR
jgi:acyl-CoA synthetase (NDP forming)/RimJ/RimL family protein N-acetyltransferase